MDYSLPCSVHGISQARILEWVAISTSRESSWPRNQTWISCGSWVGRWILYPKWTFPFQNTEIWNSSGSFLFLYLPPPYPKRVSRIWHYLVLVPNLSIALVMPSSHLILWWPLLPLPSIFPFIRDFSNELAVGIRWPKYWSFSFSISPSKSIQGWFSSRLAGLISFQSKGHSGVFPSTTVRRIQFFGALPSLRYSP